MWRRAMLAGDGRVGLEHDGLLDAQQRALAQRLAGHRRVLDGHEVGVGAGGAGGGQLEHLGAEGGQHPLGRLGVGSAAMNSDESMASR